MPEQLLELSQGIQRRRLPDRCITKESVRSPDRLLLGKEDTAALLTLKKELTSGVRKLLQDRKKGKPCITGEQARTLYQSQDASYQCLSAEIRSLSDQLVSIS